MISELFIHYLFFFLLPDFFWTPTYSDVDARATKFDFWRITMETRKTMWKMFTRLLSFIKQMSSGIVRGGFQCHSGLVHCQIKVHLTRRCTDFAITLALVVFCKVSTTLVCFVDCHLKYRQEGSSIICSRGLSSY